MSYLQLFVAIITEVIATTLLRYTDGFKAAMPTIFTFIFYGVSFYFLSLCMKQIPTSVVYAIWSGVGIVLISLTSYFIQKQILDIPAILGISLIISGVLVIRLFSKAA